MLKPLLQLTAVGVVGILLWKVAAAFFVPIVLLVLKVAFAIALVLLAVWLFKRMDKGKDPEKGEGT
jgi:flagellar biogenesis protein FliO